MSANALLVFKASLLYASKSARWLKSALTHVLLFWLFLGSSLVYGQNVASLTPTISADGSLTCAIKNDGSLICWGWGSVLSDETIDAIFPNFPKTGQFSQLSISITHGCAVKTDNTLVCWGKNDYGQATPPSGQFLQVSVGGDHSCGLKADNTIICWGDNQFGQATPPTGTFLQVDAGGLSTCAIKNDNTVFCWGNNAIFTPAPDTFSQISAGLWGTCGVKKNDSALACWGTQDTPPSGTFSAVNVGISHNCAIRTDGTLACWGITNDFGQATPPSGTFSQVTAGMFHTCGVKTDGTVACWGDDTFAPAITVLVPGSQVVPPVNQPVNTTFMGTWVNDDENTSGMTRIIIDTDGVTMTVHGYGKCHPTDCDWEIVTASYTGNPFIVVYEFGFTTKTLTIELISDNSLHVHSVNVFHDGTNRDYEADYYMHRELSPPAVNQQPVANFTVTPAEGKAPLTITVDANVSNDPDGSIVKYDWSIDGQPLEVPEYSAEVELTLHDAGNYLITLMITDDKGATATQQHSVTVVKDSTPPTTTLGYFSSLGVGEIHSCAIKNDGTLACWGDNKDGQATPPSGTFSQLSSSIFHNCALTNNGTAACWGSNTKGQATPPSDIFLQISAGGNHSCGIKVDGTLSCWGDNSYGQATPPSGTFSQVSAGIFYTCGLKSDNGLTCWGNNYNYQGNYVGQATPPDGKFLQINTSQLYTCGIQTDHTLSCWGCFANHSSASSCDSSQSTTPPSGSFSQVSIGRYSACGLKTDGALVCWGYVDILEPLPTGLFSQVATATGHACGVKNDGTVACWGFDTSGETTPPTIIALTSNTIVPPSNQPPVANFTVTPAQGEAPLTVTLDASPSFDSDGSIVSYQWSVNGQTLTGGVVTVTLENAGDYPITLTVTDDKGATGTKTGAITVSEASNQFCTSGSVIIDNTSTTCINGNCTSSGIKLNCYDGCQWCDSNNNCGNILYNGVTPISGGSISCTNGQCSGPGISFNCKNSISVTNQTPKADFYVSPDGGQAPLTVALDASPSFDSDGSIVSYQWSVNGQTLSGKTVSVTLDQAGDYPIVLTVTDDKEATGTKTGTITVTQPVATNQPPKADYYASPNSGQAPLTVTLDASPSSDSDGSIVSYQWVVNGQTLSEKTVSVTLEKAGDYPVTLTVTDDKGATDTKTDKITVSQPVVANQPPIANYSASPTSGQAPLTVTLDASLSSDPDGSIVSYQWSVNGQTLSGKTVSVTLDQAGDYLIALTVTDDKGATGTKTDKITVSQPVATNQPPKADYYASPTSGQAPLTVTLDASSSTDADGSIVSYQWSVNGQTLTGKTVTVTLENAGDYPITLTVTDDKGATGTKTYAITVSSPAVTAPKIRIEPTALNFDNIQGVKKGLRNASDLPVEIHKIPSNQELFVETGLPIEEQPADPTITRLRKVGINLNALSQTDATFGVVYTEKVTLNLFPEMSYTVNNTAINYRGKNDYTWIGKIDGTQFGDVILVVKDGRITGNVNAQGEVYRIRPSQDGWHVIQKMNPAAFPEDAPSPPSFIPPESLPSDEEQRSQSRSARGTRDSSPPIIDVMVVYTPVVAQTSTSNMDIVSEIQLAVEETNQAYANSAIKQRLRLVHTEQVNYTEIGWGDLDRLTNTKDGLLDEVHKLRDTYKADLVSLWVEDGKQQYCGIGSLMSHPSKDFAAHGFTVVERHCATAPVYAFAHELGHNMGAHHDKGATFNGQPAGCLDGSAPYPYSCGYIHDTGSENGSWRTIMAYDTCYQEKGYSCERIPYFSNPDIMYQGIATGDASANNALTLNNTADIVASFRESSNLLTEETKKFTIYNDGDADLVVSTIAVESNASWIAVSPKTATLSPKGSTTVSVKVYYTLAPSGQSTSRLLVSSNDSTNSVWPVNIMVNYQIDTAAAAPADVYDGDMQSLSVTAQAGGGTYQAVLNPITLQASVIGSIFGIGGYTPVESGVLGEAVTTYDPLTGIVRIPIGSTYLPTGEPVLFEVEMKETSPGIFEITNFLIIPVQAIE